MRCPSALRSGKCQVDLHCITRDLKQRTQTKQLNSNFDPEGDIPLSPSSGPLLANEINLHA